MLELGRREGVDYVLEERYADGRLDRLASFAQELAAKKPALIVAAPGRAAAVMSKAAPAIPIVQATGDSAVFHGIAKSLAQPGGMVTGLTSIPGELADKFIELLLAASPGLKRVGLLVDATSPDLRRLEEQTRRAVEHYKVELRMAEAAKAEDFEGALSRLAKEGVEGLVIRPSGWFNAERQRIIKLALAHRWPVVAPNMAYVEEGALLSYGVDNIALFRRSAYYVDRILKGAKPSDLPIEQPTVFELAVNLKTAKLLGINVPPEIMVRATQVIK
jgi:putative ABC transport system substrate-binding protein